MRKLESRHSVSARTLRLPDCQNATATRRSGWPLERVPRECRLAGILNLGSEWSRSCRFRCARNSTKLRERSQRRRLWAATDANQHWFKECMALANTAGKNLKPYEARWVRRPQGLEQFFLRGEHCVQPCFDGLDSTQRLLVVNALIYGFWRGILLD